jgi:surfactin synthase thioesterase subunit
MNPITRPHRLDAPALRLVVFHHAGGSAASYFPLTRGLPREWDPLLVDLPGRGKRHASPPLADMGELAAVATDDLMPWADGPPLALFGHSLGAVVAFEVARTLESRGVFPAWVGVSGRGTPGGTVALHGIQHDLPDMDLLDRLTRLGGMPQRLDQVPDFRERFLRLIRADLRALDSYRPEPGRQPLAAALTAFGAADDPLAPPSALGAWARESSGGFRQRVLPGGHFHFLLDAFEGFTHALIEEVQSSVRLAPAGQAAPTRTA